MPPKSRAGPAKGAKGTKGTKGRSTKSASSSSALNPKSSGSKPKLPQHKPAPRANPLKSVKKKPPHMRYSEKELKVPALNGIRPAGVQKMPNQKKGKKFVDDGEGMRTIMAMVMAEKEGDVESRMMRARQLEEVRAAKRAEMEKRAQGKKEGLEDRKAEIKGGKKRRRGGESKDLNGSKEDETPGKAFKVRKRVSFG